MARTHYNEKADITVEKCPHITPVYLIRIE